MVLIFTDCKGGCEMSGSGELRPKILEVMSLFPLKEIEILKLLGGSSGFLREFKLLWYPARWLPVA